MKVLALSEDDIRSVTSMRGAITAMRTAMLDLHEGRVLAPLRTAVAQPDGVSLFMPAGSTTATGVKIVSVFDSNPSRGLPAIAGMYILLDPTTGQPLSIMSAGFLTALRTGATCGLATDLLASPDASVLTVFGAGGQAQALIDATRAVRPISEIRILSASGTTAQDLAARQRPAARAFNDIEDALDGADIVITATTSSTPLFLKEMLPERVHIGAIGSFDHSMSELPPDCLAEADVVVEHAATALEESGELVAAVRGGFLDPNSLIELGALIAGNAELANKPRSVFKSVGNAAEDITIAAGIYRAAVARNLGQTVIL